MDAIEIKASFLMSQVKCDRSSMINTSVIPPWECDFEVFVEVVESIKMFFSIMVGYFGGCPNYDAGIEYIAECIDEFV